MTMYSISDHHSAVIYGKGDSNGLKAVPRDDRSKSDSSNHDTITGVFISRLLPRTTPKDLQVRIHRETGLPINPYKMSTRNPSYASFYIEAGRADRLILLNPELWPTNSLIKAFVGKPRF